MKKQNKVHKTRENKAEAEYSFTLKAVFAMACILMIMAAAIAEGGRFIPSLIFMVISLLGLGYVAIETNRGG